MPIFGKPVTTYVAEGRPEALEIVREWHRSQRGRLNRLAKDLGIPTRSEDTALADGLTLRLALESGWQIARSDLENYPGLIKHYGKPRYNPMERRYDIRVIGNDDDRSA